MKEHNAIGESMMLMQQMVGFSCLLIALSFLVAGDLFDFALLAGIACALLCERSGGLFAKRKPG